MMINMMQTVIKNSVTELVNALAVHLQFTPLEENLDTTELDVNLELSRVEDVPQLPLFIVDVVLKQTHLDLDPSRKLARETFQSLMQLWVQYLTGVKSLIGDSIYHPFTKFSLYKIAFFQ